MRLRRIGRRGPEFRQALFHAATLHKRPTMKNATDRVILPEPMFVAEHQQALTVIARRREVPPEVANRNRKPQRM